MKLENRMELRLRQLARQFKILKGWRISLVPADEHAGKVEYKPKQRCGIVHDFKGERPVDFFLHEVLHLCLIALSRMDRRKPKELRQAEEELVMDICELFTQVMEGSRCSASHSR